MIDLKKLIDSGVHFGHKTSRWSPKMAGYIWGSRNGIHLIDVSKTAFLLKKAGEKLYELAKNGGQIILVGTKKSAKESMKAAALKLNLPYVVERWIGGTLTNNDQVKKAVTRLLHLRDVMGKGDLNLGKKEQSMLTKEVARLERNVGGIINLAYPPAALVVVDAKREYSAIREAAFIGIPVIGLVDTNTNPEGVSYIIPGNDDSPRSVECVVEYLSEQIAKGLAEYEATKPAPTVTSKVFGEKPAHKTGKFVQKNDKNHGPRKPVFTEKTKIEIGEVTVVEPKKVVKEAEVVAAEPVKADVAVEAEAPKATKKVAMAKAAPKKAPAKKEVAEEKAPAKKVATKPMATKKPAAKKEPAKTSKK
ncbi:30S ribosomal protein S2 [Candidatus Dependentiae bacterium]|nr:30S ribosomal protein S2 [Candidatus Dependentiae bacterium]